MEADYSKSTDASKVIDTIFNKNKETYTTSGAQTADLNKATEEAYRQKQLQGQQAQSQFARDTAATQMSAMDAIRRTNASAIANGANAGLSAANQLSAILGLQDTATEGATQLANDAIDAASERNTAMAQNAVTGLTQANQLNQGALNREATLAALFPQLNAAEAERAKADATTEAAQIGADATKYTTDTQAETAKDQLDAQMSSFLYQIRTDMKKEGYSDNQVAAMENRMLESLKGLGINVTTGSGLSQGMLTPEEQKAKDKAATAKAKDIAAYRDKMTKELEAAAQDRLRQEDLAYAKERYTNPRAIVLYLEQQKTLREAEGQAEGQAAQIKAAVDTLVEEYTQKSYGSGK